MTFIRAASILYGLNNNAIFKVSLQTTFYYELSRKLPDRPKQKLAYSMAILFHRKYMGSIENVHVYRFNVFRTKNGLKGKSYFRSRVIWWMGFSIRKQVFFCNKFCRSQRMRPEVEKYNKFIRLQEDYIYKLYPTSTDKMLIK